GEGPAEVFSDCSPLPPAMRGERHNPPGGISPGLGRLPMQVPKKDISLITRALRRGAALGTAALAFSALAVVSPPAHAADLGNLTITAIDQYGRPVDSSVQVYKVSDATPVIEDGAGGGGGGIGFPAFKSTHTFTGIPTDGYAIQTITV